MKKDLLDVINNIDGLVQNLALSAVIFSSVLGVVLAGYSAARLHDKLNNVDYSGQFGSEWGYVAGIIIGGLVSISSIVVAWFGLFFG